MGGIALAPQPAMVNFYRLLIPMALLFAMNVAPAQSSDQLGRSWPLLIQKLEDQGVKRIGDLNLRDFTRAAKNISWHSIQGAPPSELTGDRQTGLYIGSGGNSPSGRVFISRNRPSEDLSSMPALELHEVWGALGFNENHTALTTALVAIAETEDAIERARLIQVYGRTLFRKQALRVAGGSGVSGGGDLSAIAVKNAVFKLIRAIDSELYGQVRPNVLVNFPQINFEPIRQADVTKVSLAYNFQRNRNSGSCRPGSQTFKEWITVYVPLSRWRAGEHERQSLLNEIAGQLHEIIPTSNGVDFSPSRDPNVRAIQDDRAMLLKVCGDNGNMIDSGGVSTNAQPPEKLLLKQPGSHYFNCTFSAPGLNSFTQILRPMAGKSSTTSFSYDVDGRRRVMGGVQVDAKGNLVGTMIFHQSEESSVPRWENARASDRDSGSITAQAYGHNITLTCMRQ